MERAQMLGSHALGLSSPNPAVGAVIVKDGVVVGEGSTQEAGGHHAEIIALQQAGELAKDATLYVTLEPCPMCAQAISLARLRRLYYGASDPKGGGVEHGPRIFTQATCHHRPELYGGIDETRASELLRDFFSARR